MTDRTTSDLAALLTPAPSAGVQFSQGRVLTWDNETLHNTIEWRGITVTDVPIVEGINALVIRPGDIVGMLGWAPENSKGVGSWWILGKLSNPGEFVGDLDVTAKIFRFVTEQGHVLAFFGKEIDGDPTWILNYGDPEENAAIRVTNNDFLAIYDRSQHEVFSTDGETHTGIARPWIPYRLVPGFNAESGGAGVVAHWPSTTNAAYTQMLTGLNPLWHPRISVGVATTTIGGGSAGWQFRINGTVVHTSSSPGSATVDVPGWGTSISPGDVINLEVFGRIEGAATRAWFQCDRLYGRQSLWLRLPTSPTWCVGRIRPDSAPWRSMAFKTAPRPPASICGSSKAT